MIPFLQDLVLKDFWLKLFSFALAALIWFTVNIAIKNDISPVASLSLAPTEQLILRNLPIAILSPSQQVRGLSINPKTADVIVQGDAASLRNLQRQNVRVLVDLSGDSGALQNSRRRVEVSTPAGITHVKVDPEEVQITTNQMN
jgi:YbbR domain-containing protein